jgi:hypothetical protein
MKSEPKYIVKFTKAEIDGGTVWYTIDVVVLLIRCTNPMKKSTGPSRNASATCAICTSAAKRANTKTNCPPSLIASSSTLPNYPSSRNA